MGREFWLRNVGLSVRRILSNQHEIMFNIYYDHDL